MHLKLNITNYTIKHSWPGNPVVCVLARKIFPLLKKGHRVEISGQYTMIYGPDDRYWPILKIAHSKKNRQIIRLFDINKLKPCSTSVNIPKKFLKLSLKGK